MWKTELKKNFDCRCGGGPLLLTLLHGVRFEIEILYHRIPRIIFINTGMIVENLEKIVVFGKVR